MSETRLPRLLDASLNEVCRLHPVECEITLNLTGVSEASMVLPEGAEIPPMHSFVELYTARGSAGIFRVTNVSTTYLQETSVTLRHARDVLNDARWRAQETWSGTLTQFLTRLLTFQTAKVGNTALWALGSCACGSSYTDKPMNYDNLEGLIEAIEADEPDYCFTYDQSSFPWTISLIEKPAGIVSEFRLGRNIDRLSVTMDDSDMCNRLRLSGTQVSTSSSGGKTANVAYRDYNNSTSQAAWGVIEKVADIEVTEDVKAGQHAEMDAWAAKFLAQRGDPAAQIEIDGRDLKALTDDTWDEAKLGRLCRVALPGYSVSLTERVVAITWPDPIDDPLSVRVSLSNTLPTFSETLAQVQKTASGAARSAARTAKEAELNTSWSMICRDIEECVDGVGLQTLWESGIIIDAHSGTRIYSLTEGIDALNSEIKVNAAGIASHSTTIGGIQTAINQNAAEVNVIAVGAGYQIDQDGHVVVDPTTGDPVWSDGSHGTSLFSRVSTNAGNIALVVGSNGIRAGEIALAINGQTGASTVKIAADVIDINGIVTELEAYSIHIGGLTVEGLTDFYQGVYSEDTITCDEDIVAATYVEAGSGFKLGNSTIIDSSGNATFAGLTLGQTDMGSSHVGVTKTVDFTTGEITLTFDKADGSTPDTVTFSRAATLSGAWNGSTYEVSAGSSSWTINFNPNVSSSATWTTQLGSVSINSNNHAWIDFPVYIGTNPGQGETFTASVTRNHSINLSSLFDPYCEYNLNPGDTVDDEYTSGAYIGARRIKINVSGGGGTTAHSNCADGLTQINAVSTQQSTQMYAYVNGTLTNMGTGFWYVRQTYMAPTTMYT